jgi:arsenite-transporting ATPase
MLVLNGVFHATDTSDAVANSFETRGRTALEALPAGLADLPRVEVPLLPFGLVGIDALRELFRSDRSATGSPQRPKLDTPAFGAESLDALIESIAAQGHGVVMTMGKGGVGKTSVAARIATELAARGHPVILTTTDPAAHVEYASRGRDGKKRPKTLTVTRIDPALETRRYTEEVLATAGKDLDVQGRALLAEDLRSPCTEEIAVFRAFAETVARGKDGFVVIDTAPTGHTLLLLDAAESYHREVLRKPSGNPEAVKELLPRLRDPLFTRVILVTLPEATPIHEAMQLERDLARAGIKPSAWVVNQCLTPLKVSDPVLQERKAHEAPFLWELSRHAAKTVLEPWRDVGSA